MSIKPDGYSHSHAPKQTHESYINAVRDIALRYATAVRDNPQLQIAQQLPTLTDQQIEDIAHAKLVYGRGGSRSLRGITDCGRWSNGRSKEALPKRDDLVEVCALGQQDLTQVAATTIHELAHVATHSGHDRNWKAACAALGLRNVKMGCPTYYRAQFAPIVRESIHALGAPTDGAPNVDPQTLELLMRRGCIAGIGMRGGRSRGPGSGRLRKYVCAHGQIIRASTDQLAASCNVCGSPFVRS